MAGKPGSKPGNKKALKHGAYSYLAAREDGRSIAAEAQAVEAEIVDELAEKGPGGLATAKGIEELTAARMIWRYMLTSEENFWKGLRAWGWLTNSGVRNVEKGQALGKAHAKDVLADYEELVSESK